MKVHGAVNNLTSEEQGIIRAFGELYMGRHAQRLRDDGQPNAMPPWADTYWLGHQVAKCPLDLWVYQELLWETRPDLLIETGSCIGGSAFFFATIFDHIGAGHVLTVDKDVYPNQPQHPRITYLVGDCVSGPIVERMTQEAQGKRTMVCLDSLHTYDHVARELEAYAPLVTPGCALVVEDVGLNFEDEAWGSRAVNEFRVRRPDFVVDSPREKHLATGFRWLRRTT